MISNQRTEHSEDVIKPLNIWVGAQSEPPEPAPVEPSVRARAGASDVCRVSCAEVDNTAWIIGVCAGLGALAAAGAAWAALRRRRPRAAPAAAAPAPRATRPVPVADFIDHYRLMSADSDFR